MIAGVGSGGKHYTGDMDKPQFDFEGRVALVTGASRGIGRSIAHGLAACGATVVVSSRKQEACEGVVEEIRASGGKAISAACNTGDPEAISAVMQRIDAELGRLDVLINNAATNPYYGPVLEMDLGAFQKTLDVNLRGCFWAAVEAGRRMKAQGKGAILNVSSVNGRRPMDGQVVYSMTKAGLINLTQGLAREWGRLGIRVNALLPGITETRFAAALHQDAQIMALVQRLTPLGRIAQPDEMIGAALYLVSDLASYTTGETLTVDGGWLA